MMFDVRNLNNGKTKFPHVDTTLTRSYELSGGDLYRVEHNDFDFDDYGNQVEHISKIGRTANAYERQTTVTNGYPNATSFTDKVETTTTVAVAPGTPTLTNLTSFTYDGRNRLRTITTEPNSTDIKINSTKTYKYYLNGNVKEERVDAYHGVGLSNRKTR